MKLTTFFIPQKIVYLLLSLFIFLQVSCGEISEDQKTIVVDLILEKLYTEHFERKNIDDHFSEAFFNDFIENMDSSKLLLTQEDIDYLSKYKLKLDDQLKSRNFDFFNDMDRITSSNIEKVSIYYEEILSQSLNIKTKESFKIKLNKHVKNDTKLKERWRKYLTSLVLRNIVINQKKLEHKDKSLNELKQLSISEILKNQKDYFFRLSKINTSERFTLYVNTLTNLFDPHTTYLSPRNLEEFQSHISGEFEGIGASLLQTHDGIKVSSIIPGGPAWKQGELQPNDIIVMVLSQKNLQSIDISNMHISDAITLIKGPKNTPVTLTVRTNEGILKDITIIRDIVQLEETYAKSAIIIEEGNRIGYVSLPQFYTSTKENSKKKSSASDIKNLLSDLEKMGIQELIFDLRGNSGGSLEEAINIVGLFIDAGPIIQVKSKNRPTSVLKSSGKMTFKKNIVVLVDELSASASEIFAAAIQDYGRGIIVGGDHTFGKGSVQSIDYLDIYARKVYNHKEPVGALKITIQKFYRINGGSTQTKGVIPDIIIPSIYSKLDIGEKTQKHPIPWDEIEKTNYKVIKDLKPLIATLSKKSKDRVIKNSDFKEIQKYAQLLYENENENEIPLNYNVFKKSFSQSNDSKNLLENTKKEPLLIFDNIVTPSDEFKLATYEKFIDKLKVDVQLKEAVNIMLDYIDILK